MTEQISQRAIDAGAKALNDRDGQKYSYSFWRHTAEIVIEASGLLDVAEAADKLVNRSRGALVTTEMFQNLSEALGKISTPTSAFPQKGDADG